MDQIELVSSKQNADFLEKYRANARERMRVRRSADPDGMREYMRAWRKANPEKIKTGNRNWKIANLDIWKERRRESSRRYRIKHPDKMLAFKNAWNKANLEKVRLQAQRTYLKCNYGLTLEQRDELFAKQNYQCAICKSSEPRSVKGWHIDHCHNTKRVRGILCHFCNLILGHAKDNEGTLINAIEYLRGAA